MGEFPPVFELLRIEREKKGKTQSELAGVIGIPQSAYSRIETGQRELRAEEARLVAVHLKIPISRLIPLKVA